MLSTGREGLVALVGSRICHDLISPIGAINNGLELLTLDGAAASPEMQLIAQSVGNASARVRFFRVAFGDPSDQRMSEREVTSILSDLSCDQRVKLEWHVTHSVTRETVQLLFLAVMCLESTLPIGGRIDIADAGDGISLVGAGERLHIDHELWSYLETPGIAPSVSAFQVQFALLPLIAQDRRRSFSVQMTSESVSIMLPASATA